MEFDRDLDVKGLNCPLPILRTKKALAEMETGQVLHDRSADEKRHPASLTKVMTLYLVFEAIEQGKLKLSDRMTVSKAASRAQPSKLGLKPGTTIKVEDAIRALVTKSANDVAIVMPADGPPLGMAPAGTWMCTSIVS